VWVLATGCATTNAPNISAIHKAPTLNHQLQSPTADSKNQNRNELPLPAQNLFLKIYKIDPAVASEIGKLPEYQGQVADLQIRSLGRFLDLLTTASVDEKSNLRKLLEIGKPEYRRYCSPLQAIFWLLEKEEYNPKESPLKYSLNTLLKYSWKFSENERWQDFEVVTDRLNAPELINYYEIRQFKYEFRSDSSGNPYTLFRTKTGHCVDVSEFTVYCLNKGGYTASIRVVDPVPGGRGPYHVVTLFEVDGNSFIMDNGRPLKYGIVPFSKYSVD